MIENIYDIISDYKQIERNVKNIVEDILSDENIPLLIRADILIKYKDDLHLLLQIKYLYFQYLFCLFFPLANFDEYSFVFLLELLTWLVDLT